MIHIFNIKELYFAVDTNSGLVHAVDKIIYDLLMNEKFKDENKYGGYMVNMEKIQLKKLFQK